MKKQLFAILIIILFTKSIISEKSLTLELKYGESSLEYTTSFFDKTVYYISFSHSKLISKEVSNLENINITDDDAYPSIKLNLEF